MVCVILKYKEKESRRERVEPYVALVDMGLIWSIATPTAEDRQTINDTPYKWADYVHKVSSIILPRLYSNDNELQGKAHIPNIYMKVISRTFPLCKGVQNATV